MEIFANNTDSGESARNELSHLKSALFAFLLSKYPTTFSEWEMVMPDLNMEESTFNNSALKELK